ncbi:hypothetical protein Q8W71_08320 [Methylobacterium sp. NEAU 140]|uniref:hypothetical protein n=1 Tax=Methylobacterium sp. NEAU 140 TaxID=3064945 RepID=UPI002735E2A9|nr:hypothetical protein [Methylobacterium sp. NEAU 140]MDP4022623.1 hypothetical protein [Methylobacterium sp. NEAU 140]
MTTITPFAAGTFTRTRNTEQLTALKSQLDTLSTQLSTGQAAQTYGGLGSGRTTALAAQATISALAGYAAGIGSAQTRTQLAVTSLTQVATLGTSARASLLNGPQSTALNLTATKALAQSNLQTALDALNQSAGGTYLFGGRNAAAQPVVDGDTILNGTRDAAGQALAGLKTVVSEQVRADLGSNGQGRLSVAQPTATSVSLTEDPSAEARANFGFSIGTMTTTGSALTVTSTPATAATATATFAEAPTEGQRFRVVVNQPDGSQRTIDFTTTSAATVDVGTPFPVIPPGATAAADAATALAGLIAPGTLASVQSAAPTDTPPGPGLSLAFTGGTAASTTVELAGTPPRQPAVGDTLTVTLKLHDGTTTTLTLTAAASTAPASVSSFAIGADPDTTAANLSAALGNALRTAAGSTLTASATARAAQDFFAGSATPGLTPRRITFDAGGTATGYAQAPRSDTVVWYQGEDGTTDPRGTQTVQTSATGSVKIGARADEPAIRNVLAGLATVALGMPSATDANVNAAYAAVSSRAQALLSSADTSPSVQDIVTELSLASARLSDAATTNKATQNTLQNTLDGIEQAPTQEVAAKLLDVQNRLQASYQITASLSKLSLVNYIS